MTTAVITTPVQPITRAEAARLAEKCAQVLVEQFGARRVIPFGSVTGTSPWHSRSDIDLAVEGLAPGLYFKAWAALDQVLPPGIEVDLVSLESAPPELRARILGEVRMPNDNHAALKLEIQAELTNLQRLAGEVKQFLASAPEGPDRFAVAGVAKYLHDFYNGVERIFERIAVRLDGGLPPGEHWHVELLNQMAAPIAGKRPALIDGALHSTLDEFLRFRHRIRHVYSYELEWPKVKKLAEELGEAMRRVKAALETFETSLDQPWDK